VLFWRFIFCRRIRLLYAMLFFARVFRLRLYAMAEAPADGAHAPLAGCFASAPVEFAFIACRRHAREVVAER